MKRTLGLGATLVLSLFAAILLSRALIAENGLRVAAIGTTMVFTGLALSHLFLGSLSEPVRWASQKPSGRTGYRLLLGYFIVTALLYMVLHPQSWQGGLRQALDAPWKDPEMIMAIVFAPLYEEFFFRGVMQRTLAGLLSLRLEERKAQMWAIYLAALCFWIFHAPGSPGIWLAALSQGSIPLSPGPFILGLVCGFIVMRDNSLWMAILFHAFANWLGGVWGEILPNTLLPYFYS